MIIDISILKNGKADSIDIDSSLILEQEYLDKANLLSIENVKIIGNIFRDYKEYYLDLEVSGKMLLPCALTLKPVNHEFKAEIEGNVAELLEEIGESSKKTENSIDIFPIIWENILMEIPIRVVSDGIHDIKLEGNGWKFVKEEETKTNPELEKLKDLLK